MQVKLIAIIMILTGIHFPSSAQSHPKLEEALEVWRPTDSLIIADGRWYYYKDEAEIEKFNSPILSNYITNYQFYKVNMINVLGYHAPNKSRCVILYDEKKSEILLVEPFYQSGISTELIRLLIGLKFDDENHLLKFIYELQDLMIIGSEHNKEFKNTKFSNNTVSFDLMRTIFNKGVWRSIEFGIENMTLIYVASTNPATNETTFVE